MLMEWAADYLSPYVSLNREEILRVMERPPKPDLGDAAFPCFALAKRLNRSPHEVAREVAEKLSHLGGEVRAEAVGAYVNLHFSPNAWAVRLLNNVLAPGFGTAEAGRGKRVVIDMSSPNIAKPFGVGHLRSTMIGNALANLYRASGYEVVTVNHLGDWGTQFGKLIAAFTRWGDRKTLECDPMRESLRLYVKFHEEAEEEPELEDEARYWFQKLEQGDEHAAALRRFFVDASLKEFNRVYSRLGVTFDYVLGESFYNDKMGPIIGLLEQQGLLEESDGAKIVRLDHLQLPPCIIMKSDGTTIYATRDLATAFYRTREMGADQLLYVVGAEQALHFKQVFAVLDALEEGWSARCEHVAFGLMKFGGKKMSTRKGKVVFLDDVLDEAVRQAEAVIEAKNPALQSRREAAEAVGIGAIVFGDLRNSRMLEIDFSLEDALRFEGDTGPYVQYAYARAVTLLEKGMAGTEEFDEPSPEALSGRLAWECLKQLAGYPDAIRLAVEQNEPSVLARYLLDTAKQFNRFYRHERILSTDREETHARLMLTAAVAGVLKNGLALLGVKAPRHI
ncbi:arginine--tRNA ligase [Paenibacillus darwinianus]|uniref:Arginine--tRNA ligase n=1 Tax=Paenibacillus darwinianus TaxID=1380763 RepID=A0A9W5W6B5_9BACL|nr:arginine--tRNA ligase [Paenibacillus darwinianus]EXX85988.1 arginine--tRNA ligase [Paenibacillus darwinianus]EXX86250.1 arginine--tRNA ligase [Paenibacillus darwinianus]EXX86891.1 arginine--tRNA ligase [Paenibacillus darwinianus]